MAPARPGRRAARRWPGARCRPRSAPHQHPGDAVLDRLAAPPEAPATWATPAAAASRKTIPNPSCSRPSHRLRHSMAKTSAPPTSRGGPGRTPHRAGGRGRRTRPPVRPGARCPAPPGDGHREVGIRGASRAAASISTSMPLRGTRRLTLTTRGPRGSRPRSARARSRSSSSSGGTDGGRPPAGSPRPGHPRRTARRASAAG